MENIKKNNYKQFDFLVKNIYKKFIYNKNKKFI